VSVVPLDGVVMRYAWGRNDLIARLQGRPSPSATPEAELWFGAHRNGASPVHGWADCDTLAKLIAADPSRWLGADCVARFGTQLPFLLKVLAVNEPLSLQLHPDEACVAQLVAAGDVDQVLADHHPKPEMIVAVGELQALCGLSAQETAIQAVSDIVTFSADTAWQWVLRQIETGGVLAAVTALITADERRIADLMQALHAACANGFDAPAIRDLLGRYPIDRSVAIAVLLQHVVLADGEALFIPPGVLHCYLAGAGVEVMASSDNVFRVGLTAKPCHHAAVLAQLGCSVNQAVRVVAVKDAWQTSYPVDTAWFALSRMRVTPGGITPRTAPFGPQLFFTVLGHASVVDSNGVRYDVAAGTAVFVGAQAGPVTVHGDADLFQVTLG